MSTTQRQWFGLISAILLGGIGAYLHAGGPNPMLAGVPILSAVISILNLLQAQPAIAAKLSAKIYNKTST